MKTRNVAAMAIRQMVPFAPHLRRLKRRLSPYIDNVDNSSLAITEGLRQIEALKRAGITIQGQTVLEFGTGWLPLIPMLFCMAGAARLILTDIERLMDAHTTTLARHRIESRIDDIAHSMNTTRESLPAALNDFSPDYIVPWDPSTFPSGAVDLIVSRATFEHVPLNALEFFLRQFHRILRPGGAMCHVVDNSDHWQHRDRSLSRINFLRYADEDLIWKLAQLNTQGFQNRLRHGDYARLFAQAGFTPVLEVGDPDTKCLEDLKSIPLAARFASYAPEDLAILNSLFVVVRN